MAARKVWHIVQWKELYEPDDAKRKGSRTPLQYVKAWVRGDNVNIDRQKIDGLRRALVAAGGRDLAILWEWLKAAAADRSHFRGYLLSAVADRAATYKEIAVMIGPDLVQPAEISKAMKQLARLGLVEQVELIEVFEVLKDDKGNPYEAYLTSKQEDTGGDEPRRNQAEFGGIIPPNSGAVARTRGNTNANANPLPASAGSGNREHEHEQKTRTPYGDPPGVLTDAGRTNADGQRPTDPQNQRNGQRATGPQRQRDTNGAPTEADPGGTGGSGRSVPPVRPDAQGGRRPPPPETPDGRGGPIDVEPRPPDAATFAKAIFQLLGWRGDDLKARGRNNEKAVFRNCWIEYVEQADRLGLEPEAICEFADRRCRKARHLESIDLDVRTADADKHGRRIAVLKARSRIWTAETRKLIERLRDADPEAT